MSKEKELRGMSGRLRILASTLDPAKFKEEGAYLEARQIMLATADDISSKASRFAQWEGPMDLAGLADEDPMAGGDLATAEQPVEQPGKYDVSRQPAAPLWDITISRIRAGDGEQAHDIVKGLVDQLQKEGHTMAAVGTIKPSIDNPTPKGQR